jgi:hypothetical protein
MTRGLKTLTLALLGATALAAAAAPASADVVIMQARNSGNPFATTSADYVNAWNAVLAAQPTPPAGYADQVIADWNGSQSNLLTGGGAATDLAYHDHVLFTAPTTGLYSFRFGIDFGRGGTLLLDGGEVETRTTDMWWSYSFSDPSQYLKGAAVLTAGAHTFDLYGFEGCCDGGTTGQWAKGTDVFHDFTTTPGVPEPATWGLMILGFGAAGSMLRRRKLAVA